MKRHLARAGGFALALGALGAFAAAATAAQAQSHGYYSRDPNVTIDLSVLDGVSGGGPGYAGSGYEGGAGSPYGLQFPPPSPPRSRLEGPLAGRNLQLVRPSTASDGPAARPAPPPAAEPPASRQAARAPEPAGPPPASPPPASPPPASPPPAYSPAASATSDATARAAVPATPASAPPQSAPPAAPSVAPPPAPEPPASLTASGEEAGEPPAAAPSAPARETETASRPPAAAGGVAPAPDGTTRILFETGSAKVPESGAAALDALARQLNDNDALRVQIMAYATGEADAANPARRLSLSRALAVRSALIDKGVRSTRMDVRALGNKHGDEPTDRVDAVLVER